jgi:hypothetical protein
MEIGNAVCGKFGGEILCASELDYSSTKICTGKYKNALHGKNKEICVPLDWQNNLHETCFITDDTNSDKSLLDAVSHPVYITPAKPASCKTNTLRRSFPGVYYYTSRYNHNYERIAHLFKFWGTYYLVLWLTAKDTIHFEYSILVFIAWLAIYDIGCKQNDILADAEKNGTRRKKCDSDKSILGFITPRIIWTAICIIILGLLNVTAGMCALILIIALSGVFTIHNSISPNNRGLTFFLLYLMKGIVPLFSVAATLPPSPIYFVFCLLFSLAYLPKYIFLKRSVTPQETEAIKNNLLLQPILWKNLLLAVLSVINIPFIFVMIWVDLITALEFLGQKLFVRKELYTNG